MEFSDFIDTDLSGFEEQLAQQLLRITPDVAFVEDLRKNLLGSRVFEYRRAIGAIVVASLSVLLTGTLVYCFGKLARKATKILEN